MSITITLTGDTAEDFEQRKEAIEEALGSSVSRQTALQLMLADADSEADVSIPTR